MKHSDCTMDMKNYSKPTAENKLSKGTIEKEYYVPIHVKITK